MAAHQNEIEAILQINPGNIFVQVDTFTCPGKADLVISYPAHADRVKIEAILSQTPLGDLPIRLRNE